MYTIVRIESQLFGCRLFQYYLCDVWTEDMNKKAFANIFYPLGNEAHIWKLVALCQIQWIEVAFAQYSSYLISDAFAVGT